MTAASIEIRDKGIQRPLISVILPTYNVEKFIEEAVHSILNQTWENLELIIVDDCSTDGTYEVLKELASTDNRIKLLRNKHNSKICVTLNRAWKEAKGAYIARMDGDDISVSNRLEILAKYLETHPDIDLVGSQVISINERGTILSYKECLRYPKYIQRGNRIGPCVLHIWLARRSVYEKLNGYRNIPYVEDYDFLLRGEAIGLKYANVEEYLYKVRIRGGNTGSSNGLKQRKAKDYVQCVNGINKGREFKEFDEDEFAQAIQCSAKELLQYDKARKHLDVAVSSRKQPIKLVAHTLIGMLVSKYIAKYIIEAVKLRLLLREENKEYPRSK